MTLLKMKSWIRSKYCLDITSIFILRQLDWFLLHSNYFTVSVVNIDTIIILQFILDLKELREIRQDLSRVCNEFLKRWIYARRNEQ